MTPKTKAARGRSIRRCWRGIGAAPMGSRGRPCPRRGRRTFAAPGEGGVTWRALRRGGTRRSAMSSLNQACREDLRAHGEGRDCEAPLLLSKRNNSRCGVYRAKRNARRTEARGRGPEALAAMHEKVQAAMLERIRVLGYDDGADDREAVRRCWAA